MDGALLVDKPAGPTSHDIVLEVRRILHQRRCGHAGTLDPFATGLLILCLGRATRLARFVTDAYKSYEATIRFGFATDTYDRTGTALAPPLDVEPERDAVVRTLSAFEGRQQQRPPAFSAKKLQGKRAYRLAREGEPVTVPPVEIDIRTLELCGIEGARVRIRATVSSGTYIRSLAHDVGERLGVPSHLEALRRTAIGSFAVSEAVDMETLADKGPGRSFLAPEEVLRDLPTARVGFSAARRLVHGRGPDWGELDFEDERRKDGPVRVLGPSGELLAVGEPAPSGIRPLVVWAQNSKNH